MDIFLFYGSWILGILVLPCVAFLVIAQHFIHTPQNLTRAVRYFFIGWTIVAITFATMFYLHMVGLMLLTITMVLPVFVGVSALLVGFYTREFVKGLKK